MLPHDDDIAFMFEATAYWVRGCNGGAEFLQDAILVLPNEEDFPVDTGLSGMDLAYDYLAFVKEHYGCADLDVELVRRGPRPRPIGDPFVDDLLSTERAPLCELPEESGDRVRIPIHHSPSSDPEAMVFEMSRGIAAYMMCCTAEEPPSDECAGQAVAEVGLALFGFGVFGANTAVRFAQSGDAQWTDWKSERNSALGEMGSAYALALMVALADIPPRPVLKHLARGNPRGYFKSALKHVRKKRRDELAKLRAMPAYDLSAGPYR